MRVAFVSDVHANIHALEAVFEHAIAEGAARVFCLGDIVGYNAFPNECIARLRKGDATAVQGNHDWAATEGDAEGFNPFAVAGVDYSRRTLSPEHRRWLVDLPREVHLEVEGVSLGLYHGSPRDPLYEYVFPSADSRVLRELAKAAGQPRVVALGHTHLPMRLDQGATFLNPGSVGQPRDGDPRASYALLDTRSMDTMFHRVPYDVEAAARAVREAGLPEFLWQRLLRGM